MRKRAMLESPPSLGTTGPGRESLGASTASPGRTSHVDPDLYQDGYSSVGASPPCMQQANTARYFVSELAGTARRVPGVKMGVVVGVTAETASGGAMLVAPAAADPVADFPGRSIMPGVSSLEIGSLPVLDVLDRRC